MNLFERRATEYVKDEDSFLSLITPDPIERFFKKEAETLYVHPVWVLGNPGCGKTTVAQVFTLSSIVKLLRTPKAEAYRDLLAALSDCDAVKGGVPTVNGYRLPMESDYRAIWELPYPEAQRHGLLTALVQARSVLGWLRGMEAAGANLRDVVVHADNRAPAVVDSAGLSTALALRDRARQVERALYAITSALVPREMTDDELSVISAYRPFDALEGLSFPQGWLDTTTSTRMRPLVMLDDVQRLSPEQFSHVREWLSRREMCVARWLLTWPDSVPPEVGLSLVRTVQGGPTARDVTVVRLGGVPRPEERKAFDRAARDMASRYLGRMHIFEVRRVKSLEELLSTKVPQPAKKVVDQLAAENAKAARDYGLGPAQLAEIQRAVAAFAEGTTDENVGPDVRLAMESILIHRSGAGRHPRLFGSPDDADPVQDLKADAPMAEGARVRLARDFGRPLYFGVSALTEAGTMNAELFLRLCSSLVGRSMTQITRRDAKALPPEVQDMLLREAAADVIARWDFQGADDVRRLIDGIGTRCYEASIRPNAPLGGGANAYGIPMADYERMQSATPAAAPELVRLRRTIQVAVAHTGVVLALEYKCKNKSWCLVELGGSAIMTKGLTLRRGGFVEGTAHALAEFLKGGQ